MKHSKKKKRSRASKRSGDAAPPGNAEVSSNPRKDLLSLVGGFGAVSLDEAAPSYEESDLVIENGDRDPSISSTCSGVSGSTSNSNWASSGSTPSEGSLEVEDLNLGGKGSRRRNKLKRVVAATGTVSTVLGKDYVKRDYATQKGIVGFEASLENEDAEQFLCSMLGGNCQLSMGVVKDVLCSKCAARPISFLSRAVPARKTRKSCYGPSSRTSQTDKGKFQQNIIPGGYNCWNNFRVSARSEEAEGQYSQRSDKSDIPQKVLDSLFSIRESSVHKPGTMNWRNVVKKLESLGNGFNIQPSSTTESHKNTYAEGDEYHVLRKGAQQQWDSTKSLYQKAAAAYSKGERQYAGYLSEQGRRQTKIAREADERASHDIFKARNRGIENVITIDLHGQHVKQAMKLLKLHLLFGTHVPSIQAVRVITGCGTHGLGKSKLKQSVIKLLEKEEVKWNEENQGTVLIKLDGYREFSFLDIDSDSE